MFKITTIFLLIDIFDEYSFSISFPSPSPFPQHNIQSVLNKINRIFLMNTVYLLKSKFLLKVANVSIEFLLCH